jgi:hypothetical protein
MRHTFFLFFIVLHCLGWQIMGTAQTVPVGQMDDTLRNLQLMGKLDPNQSLTIRPYFSQRSIPDSSGKIKPQFVKLPSIITVKFNSHHPYGWNDQGMLAAKGLQTELTAGIFAQYGPVSVQLQPQFVYAANPGFENNADYGASTTGGFAKLFPGQSSIRLHAGPVSFGFSSENLWWGPGQYSSLLLSNNAPGFTHFTLNTTRPILTPIGSFEFQIIGGRLDEDSAANMLYENFQLKPMQFQDEWRYLNAMVLTYQPSFLKGVFWGITRSFQLYNSDLDIQSSFIQKYLPVFTAFLKSKTDDEDLKSRDQAISLFMRWLLPKVRAEFYIEYGWNDHKANIRDLMLDPTHAAAFIVGGKKLLPLRTGDWLEFNAEITQMAQSPNYVIRNSGNWYIHSQIMQGMTHRNQILGAGSGLGNNVQTFSVSWLQGIKKLGFLIQRIQHDPVALTGSSNSMLLREYAWTETAIGALYRWDFNKKIIAGLDLQYTWSKNYAWESDNGKGNLYGLLKIAYSW